MQRIRQGDVFLVRCQRLPQGARRRLEATLRIPGETGHAHELNGATLYEVDGRPFVAVDGQVATLTHEQHPTIDIPSGVWEVRASRIFDWPESTGSSDNTTQSSTPSQPRSTQSRGRVRPYAD